MRALRLLKLAFTWLLQILLALLFLALGAGKFMDGSWPRRFAHWGYPDGFYMVVGVLEAAGGLALLVPRLASYGAALLVTVMAGAVLTHLVYGEMQRVAPPLVYLILVGVVGLLRSGSAARIARRDAAPPPALGSRA